ncbi:MAG TPA: hypothetical protein VMG12_45460 [Polyangiaceae bacterium]|nr:hypothetical protein [Polyangiaceae bacterium]
MEKPFDRRTFAALGAIALFACNLESAASPGAPEPVQHRAYRYDGVAGSSEVTQEKTADGRESLRGTTDIEAPSAQRGRSFARETASLDEHGHLRHAEIIVGERGAAVAQYTLDPSRGAVHVERPGAPPIDWRVPNDAPWLYAPSEDGDLIASPVAGWVALRATRGADVVRVLEPEQQRTYLMTVDQVAVPTELGTTVALGSDGIDADEQFITELRLLHGAVTLARVTALDLVPRT